MQISRVSRIMRNVEEKRKMLCCILPKDDHEYAYHCLMRACDDHNGHVESIKELWDPSKHPRHPKGNPDGGKFAPKGSSSSTGTSDSPKGSSLSTPSGSDIIDAIHKNGGFTVKHAMGDAPSKGYMVSLNQQAERKFKKEELTPDHIKQYMDEHKAELAAENAYLGGWYDPETDLVYLDVASHFKDFEEAKEMGKKFKQLALYDLSAGSTVYLKEGFHGKRFWLGSASPERIHEELTRTIHPREFNRAVVKE